MNSILSYLRILHDSENERIQEIAIDAKKRLDKRHLPSSVLWDVHVRLGNIQSEDIFSDREQHRWLTNTSNKDVLTRYQTDQTNYISSLKTNNPKGFKLLSDYTQLESQRNWFIPKRISLFRNETADQWNEPDAIVMSRMNQLFQNAPDIHGNIVVFRGATRKRLPTQIGDLFYDSAFLSTSLGMKVNPFSSLNLYLLQKG